ncbi:MAG: CHAT domain-containing protein [Chlorobi bacterium]|nr:CHAT domain-containing protein [Chlorobiota bacterium]
MRKQLSLIFFVLYGVAFSQNLEDEIYVATETFNNNSNTTAYNLLEKQEAIFKDQLQTKDEQLAFVFLLCNKGYYLKNKAPNKAISSYENAWNRFSKHNLSVLSDYDIIENCLKPLGNLYIKTGDFTNAESTIKQYLYLAKQSNNKTQEIAGAINLSILYQTLGKHNSVIQIIENVLKNTIPNANQKQKILSIRNASLIALDKIESVTSLNGTIGSTSYNSEFDNYLLNLKKGDYKKALLHFNNYKKLPKKDYSLRDAAKVLVQEAQLHYLLEQPNKTINNLHEATKVLLPNYNSNALPKKEELYPENTFIDIFDLLAELQPNVEKKLHYYDLSFYVSVLLTENLTSQESKLNNITNNRIRSEKSIETCFNAFKNTKDSTLIIKAFYYAEKHKSSVLRDMSLKKLLFEQFPNDSLLQEQKQLLQKQEQITNQLINQQLFNTQNASTNNELYKSLSTVSIQLKQLKQEIATKYPNALNYDFTFEALQQKLATDNAVLVEYFYGKHAIYQFLVSNETLSFFKIDLTKENSNNIKTFIHQFDNASVINNNIKNFTQNAFSTFKTLNFSKTHSYKNILIVPDGLLNFIPFEALLATKTSTTSYSKMPFVVTKHRIAYNYSVQFYLKQNNPIKGLSVLGVFPVFENTNQTLTYSINEANAIKKEMNATLLMQDQATKSNFIKNASKFDILHLSTHATSGTLTKPARIEFYDSTMYLNELYSLNINNELVVLSACETGVGRLQKGEGALSIARGFQYAGAKRMLFSLWQINDLSTSQIMQLFYKDYSTNNSGVDANHNSKINYLKNEAINNIKKSPYYWSAFVYYGDFSSISETPFLDIYTYLFVAIVIIVLLLIYKINSNAKSPKRFSS